MSELREELGEMIFKSLLEQGVLGFNEKFHSGENFAKFKKENIDVINSNLDNEKSINNLLSLFKDNPEITNKLKEHANFLKAPDMDYVLDMFKDKDINSFEVLKASLVLQAENLLTDESKQEVEAKELVNYIYSDVYLEVDRFDIVSGIDIACYAINDGTTTFEKMQELSKNELSACLSNDCDTQFEDFNNLKGTDKNNDLSFDEDISKDDIDLKI